MKEIGFGNTFGSELVQFWTSKLFQYFIIYSPFLHFCYIWVVY